MTPGEGIQAVGVLAFAALVLRVLRDLKPLLTDLTENMFEMRITFAAMLEREHIRDRRRKRDSGEQATQRLRVVPTGEFEDEETTDIVRLIEKQREEAIKRRSIRAPRRGTHHDGED